LGGPGSWAWGAVHRRNRFVLIANSILNYGGIQFEVSCSTLMLVIAYTIMHPDLAATTAPLRVESAGRLYHSRAVWPGARTACFMGQARSSSVRRQDNKMQILVTPWVLLLATSLSFAAAPAPAAVPSATASAYRWPHGHRVVPVGYPLPAPPELRTPTGRTVIIRGERHSGTNWLSSMLYKNCVAPGSFWMPLMGFGPKRFTQGEALG